MLHGGGEGTQRGVSPPPPNRRESLKAYHEAVLRTAGVRGFTFHLDLSLGLHQKSSFLVADENLCQEAAGRFGPLKAVRVGHYDRGVEGGGGAQQRRWGAAVAAIAVAVLCQHVLVVLLGEDAL